MRRLLAAVMLLLFVLVYPSWGTVDTGNSAVTRLWGSDNVFTCTGWYWKPYQDAGAWLVSAGHCARPAKYAKRSADHFISSWIDWRVALAVYMPATAMNDIAVGTMPDPRIGERKWYNFLADKMPSEGSVYVHGFPGGVEKVIRADVVGKPKEYPNAPYAWEIETPGVGDIIGGASGAPVLNEAGFVVGVVWAMRAEPITGAKTNRAIVTDIAALHQLVKEFKVGEE